MNRCLSLYKQRPGEGFCNKAVKMLFRGRKVAAYLDFDAPQYLLDNAFSSNIQQISISGVQLKHSLRLAGNHLQLTQSGGEYLLKPIPVGRFQYLDLAPENEHLMMQIAAQVYGIETASNALIYFKNGEPAYLVKRFDVREDGRKWLQEDFSQIKQVSRQQNGENYKYEGSYEEIACLIQKHCAAWPIEVEKFFKLVIFNYLFSNGDAHLKNFSLIQTAFGDFSLTPAYDLFCTAVHTPFESAMALDLFANDYFTNAYNTLGYYSYADFYEFGIRVGISHQRTEKIIQLLSNRSDSVQQMIDNSFLPISLQHLYWQQYQSRWKALTYRLITD
ncbi:MAG: HipA domain-containing protein [Spirosomataceae bacterium]